MTQQGFVDLRQNQENGSTGEHFWPSFTDIMTVIVMIFMLASVVLVIRNWELLENLKQSIQAEREASEGLRFKSEENATLEEQLAQTQYQLSMLRMQLMQAEELAAQHASTIQTLKGDKRRLQEDLAVATDHLQRQTAQLNQTSGTLAALQQQYQVQTRQVEGLQGQVTELETETRRQAERIDTLLEEGSQNTAQLATLQDEYGVLKKKYDKLVKPARSPKGKYVVEVRYQKLNGKYQIQLRDPSDKQLHRVSRKTLDKKLSKLKQAHPNKLYIKIIIPADSGLSYAEAWTFMKSVLEKYDYYYQE
jgi:chromosome segregation ATPase